MKHITFSGGGTLAGLANMLAYHGFDAEDRAIALEMEAPYLFVRRNGHYQAGVKLYQLEFLNLYLHKHGFHLRQDMLAREDVCAVLRTHAPAMLTIAVTKSATHPALFRGYTNGRYEFDNIKSAESTEPDMLSLSSAMLKRRLAAEVTVFTLETCARESTDMKPLLLESLRTLTAYRTDVLSAREQTMTREEFSALHEPLFRALMQDYRAMALLTGDMTLSNELELLEHDYKHVFLYNSPERVALNTCLPRTSIRSCILWIHEDIIDRLSELGMDDDELEQAMKL